MFLLVTTTIFVCVFNFNSAYETLRGKRLRVITGRKSLREKKNKERKRENKLERERERERERILDILKPPGFYEAQRIVSVTKKKCLRLYEKIKRTS